MRPIWLIGPLAVLAALACAPKEEASAKEPAKKIQVQGRSVTAIYDTNCGNCHGRRAEGGGGGTPSLLTLDKYHQKWDKPFFDAIKNGVKDMGMEPFGESMDDATVWAMVVHIRELQRDALREETKPKATGGMYESGGIKYRIEEVVDTKQGLRTPWSLDWLPDGRMLVSNRPGGISVLTGGKATGTINGLPPTVEMGQGGQMEVAVHPDYKKNGWVYLSFADPKSNGAMTRLVRGKLKANGGDFDWVSQQDIWTAPDRQYVRSGVHFGCKIVFDGTGHIFFSTGERGSGELAQDLTRTNGKIHRLNEDGSVPKDNPFVARQGALGSIWSYGHRNPQGLAQGLSGELVDTEHGPRGGDEMNVIDKGANYGWPKIAFSINYNDTVLTTAYPSADQNFKMPAFRWLPSIGASGLAVVNSPKFKAWRGDFVAGGLAGGNLDRIRLKDGKMVSQETILRDMGRVRDVRVGPDGAIYVVLNGADRIVRIVAQS
ncbi:MAG: PQQ-dependent sugar dehydrogenase [Chthonomonas sp.]|nr:PQQ-dependent sugar dehydrogenase [Chthonomonas sp.]